MAHLNPSCLLEGSSSLEGGQVDSWIEFAYLELGLSFDESVPVDYVADALKALESALATKTYMVGDSISLADIALCAGLMRFPLDAVTSSTNVTRWFATVMRQEPLKAVFGDVTAGLNVPTASGSSGLSAAADVSEVEASDNKAVALLKELGIANTT